MTCECHIAVLSYHAWEIDPQLVIDDVRQLRHEGWQDISLDELHRILTGEMKHSRPVFHVTSDDGTRADADFVAALQTVSCPATLFICLERMQEETELFFRQLSHSSDYRLGDHTLRHDRTFRFRHVIGFHNVGRSILSSPERLGLKMGTPICSYGPELCSPRFTPARDAVEVCHAAARGLRDQTPDCEWDTVLAAALIKSGLGFYRFGRLCIRGNYETRSDWEERVRVYLHQGRDALQQFTRQEPFAFAFPWWESGTVAERHLRALGYKLVFSGRGLCKEFQTFRIPRLPIATTTPRPLDLAKLDSLCPTPNTFVGSFARRLFFA